MSSFVSDDCIKFSILIPSYNRPNFLKQTIQSVLNSTYLNFELLISDDNSPLIDDIICVVNSFEFTTPFKFYRQKINLGPTDNKNFLVKNACGEYIIILGDDDLLDRNILNTLNAEIIRNNGNFSIYGFGYNIIDENNRQVGFYKSFKSLVIENKNKLINKIFFEGNILPFYFFHPFSICYKKSININYKKEAHIGYDFLFLYESILKNECIKVLPTIGFSWRKAQNPGLYQNLSNVKSNDLISRICIYNNFFKDSAIIDKLNFILPENHICMFLGNTILLDNTSIFEHLTLIQNNFSSEDFDKIRAYVNNNRGRFQILRIKLIQCIQLQGFLSLYYFASRIRNILLYKFSPHNNS
jgi:glycosyltransferase involved in cell wall biosynthesis